MTTTIVSNDDRSMIVESDDIEGENDDMLKFIEQSLTFSDLPLNFGNIINEVRPYKKVTTQLKIYFENPTEERQDIFTKVIFHSTRNRSKVDNPSHSNDRQSLTRTFSDNNKKTYCNCLSKLVDTFIDGIDTVMTMDTFLCINLLK
jgi:hypothetical protein